MAQSNLRNYSSNHYTNIDEKDIADVIQLLFENANSTAYQNKEPWRIAYQNSIPLLLVSLKGEDKKLYEIILKKMGTEIATFEKSHPDFAAWMWGRVLFAAINMGNDEYTIIRAATKIENCLNRAGRNAVSAWGFGYLARYYTYGATAALSSINKKYHFCISKALEITESLPTKTPDDISSALWSYVMMLHASATHHDDRMTFNQISEKMKAITKTSSIDDALEKIPSSDFKKWAMSTTYVSTAMMGGDEKICTHEKLNMMLMHSKHEIEVAYKKLSSLHLDAKSTAVDLKNFENLNRDLGNSALAFLYAAYAECCLTQKPQNKSAHAQSINALMADTHGNTAAAAAATTATAPPKNPIFKKKIK